MSWTPALPSTRRALVGARRNEPRSEQAEASKELDRSTCWPPGGAERQANHEGDQPSPDPLGVSLPGHEEREEADHHRTGDETGEGKNSGSCDAVVGA